MNNPTLNSVYRQGNIVRQLGLFGKMVLIVIACSLILTPATQAFEAKLSGQVSRMVVAPDDAVGDEVQYQDIGWSGSRFRFRGTDKMDNGIEVGFRFEIQARNNPARTDGSQLRNNGDNQDNRYQDIFFSGGFGMISFGKGDGASNGSTEVDWSGTVLASAAPLQDNWGGYKITPDTDATADMDNSIAWRSVYIMDDGLSRQNRVRYDTPNFSGFSLAASVNQGNASEVAVRYTGDWGSSKFGAAVFSATSVDVDISPPTGVTPATTRGGDEITGGSASLLLKSGLNFTVASSDNDLGAGGSRDAMFFKVGYKKGMHAFAVDVADSENALGQEGESIGFTYAIFPHPGVELFAMVRELDSTGVPGAQSVDLVAIGSRVQF
jgi:predicted porin